LGEPKDAVMTNIADIKSNSVKATSIRVGSSKAKTTESRTSSSYVRVFNPVTTAPANAANGTMIYNSTVNKLQVKTPDGWKNIAFE
jgi:hypothetical protein